MRKLLVDGDPAARADGQPGPRREARLGSDTDRGDHEVRGDPLPGRERHVVHADRRHGGAEPEIHTMPADAAVDDLGQLGVEGCHHLGRRLDDRRGKPAVHEVLGHLEADEAAADDDRGPGLAGRLDQRVRVLDGAQRERPLDAGDRRPDRGGPGR